MTVSTALCLAVRTWTGAASIATGYIADAPADVIVTATTGGVVAELTAGVHYTAALDASTRELIIYPTPAMPPQPQNLRILRKTPALQGVALSNNAKTYDAGALERELDRNAMRDAELRRDVDEIGAEITRLAELTALIAAIDAAGGIGIATLAEAQAGVVTNKAVSPYTSRQVGDGRYTQAAGLAEAQAGVSAVKAITPAVFFPAGDGRWLKFGQSAPNAAGSAGSITFLDGVAGPGILAQRDSQSLLTLRGSAGSPDTATQYARTAHVIELHSAAAPAQPVSVWGNAYKIPALTVEAEAHAGFSGELTGGSFRAFSTSPANLANSLDRRILLGFSALAQTNTGGGNASWEVFGGNIVAAQTSGAAPTNIVGLEVDVLNKSTSAGLRPGQVGATNYTGYWAQSDAAAGAISDVAFYASHTDQSNGWQYVNLFDGRCWKFMLYYRTLIQAPEAQGLYIETQYQANTCAIIDARAAGGPRFRVDGDATYPTSLWLSGALRRVRVGAPDTGGTGQRVLIVDN